MFSTHTTVLFRWLLCICFLSFSKPSHYYNCHNIQYAGLKLSRLHHLCHYYYCQLMWAPKVQSTEKWTSFTRTEVAKKEQSLQGFQHFLTSTSKELPNCIRSSNVNVRIVFFLYIPLMLVTLIRIQMKRFVCKGASLFYIMLKWWVVFFRLQKQKLLSSNFLRFDLLKKGIEQGIVQRLHSTENQRSFMDKYTMTAGGWDCQASSRSGNELQCENMSLQ